MSGDKTVLTTFLIKFVRIDNLHIETDDRIYVKMGPSKTRMYPIIDRHVFFGKEMFVRQSVITEKKKPEILLPRSDTITVFRENKHKTIIHRKDIKIGECILDYKDFLFTRKALFGFQLVQ